MAGQQRHPSTVPSDVVLLQFVPRELMREKLSESTVLSIQSTPDVYYISFDWERLEWIGPILFFDTFLLLSPCDTPKGSHFVG